MNAKGASGSPRDMVRHKYFQNLFGAAFKAKQDGYAALVVVVDNDRRKANEAIRPLQDGRDKAANSTGLACAIGVAIETFDAWMIADANAVEACGGDKSKCHPSPESLNQPEGRGRHPKEYAIQALGDGLGELYGQVAAELDLDLLERQCPKGFGPFAGEVRKRIAPVISGKDGNA
jgi:hypothetical protein